MLDSHGYRWEPSFTASWWHAFAGDTIATQT